MSCSQKFVTEGAITIVITDEHGVNTDKDLEIKVSFMNPGSIFWQYKVVRPDMYTFSQLRLSDPECWPLVAIQGRISLPGINEGECVLVSHVRAVEL